MEVSQLAGVSIVRFQHTSIKHMFPQGYSGSVKCPEVFDGQVKVTHERDASKVMRLEMVGVGFNLDNVEFAAMAGD